MYCDSFGVERVVSAVPTVTQTIADAQEYREVGVKIPPVTRFARFVFANSSVGSIENRYVHTSTCLHTLTPPITSVGMCVPPIGANTYTAAANITGAKALTEIDNILNNEIKNPDRYDGYMERIWRTGR